ncbi:MAG: hypothetical protein Q8P67_16205 [archaeon]|nr:hypothetical protein [archaeon]
MQSSLTTGNVKSLSPMLPDKSARAALNPEMAFEPYAKTQFVKGTFKPGKGLKYVGKQAGPVLQSIKDAGLSKEAVNLFKDLQIICGELKPAKNQTVGEVVRQILMLCDSMPMFKDECLIQAVRHTCANPKPPVQQKAWEYLVICCLHFVPSKALEPFLLDYLRQRVQGDIKDHPARAAASALRNLKICEKRASVATVGMSHPKKKPKNPSCKVSNSFFHIIFFRITGGD